MIPRKKGDTEEGDYRPMPEVVVDGVILEAHSDNRNPVPKRRRKVMRKIIISTAASCTNQMVPNFTHNIND